MINKLFKLIGCLFFFTLAFCKEAVLACDGTNCKSNCNSGIIFSSKKGNEIKTVVIDAGHGGKDPGCMGALHKEKDVTLGIALKLGKLIEENLKGVKVIYTRKTDVFVELEERAQIANRNDADLFISIHCNAAATQVTYKDKKGKIRKKEVHNPKPYGSETYVMGIKNEKGNMEVAKRENAAMLLEDDYKKTYNGFDPNSDEAYIIMSIYTGAFVEQSAIFASKIQNEYIRKAGRVDKGVHRQSIWVLWRTAMPSVLTEVGFLTNPEEEKFLGSDNGQKYLSTAIFRALRNYKNEVEGSKITYNDEFENETPLENENKGKIYESIPTFIDSSLMENSTSEKNKLNEDLIGKGDLAMREGKFEDGLKYYAQVLKSNADFPGIKEKIKDCESKIESNKKFEIEKLKSAEENNLKYNTLLKEADEKFISGEYGASKKKYIEASECKPGEKYPKQRIKEIEEKQVKTDSLSKPNKSLIEILKDKQNKKEEKNSEIIEYRVQFASSDKALDLKNEKYKNLIEIMSYKVGVILKYTSGNFKTVEEAISHQKTVRDLGFKDAFIVSFKNGERIDNKPK